MIYLLHDPNDPVGASYIVYVENEDGWQGFYNEGSWTPSIPTTLGNLTENDSYVDSGIYWWQKRYTQYADARLFAKFVDEDAYYKWLDLHPEYLI